MNNQRSRTIVTTAAADSTSSLPSSVMSSSSSSTTIPPPQSILASALATAAASPPTSLQQKRKPRNQNNSKSKKLKTSTIPTMPESSDDNSVSSSIAVGNSYQIGETIFLSNRTLYVANFDDYTLLSDFDFTPFADAAPRSLKKALDKRWIYVVHVSHGMAPSVTRNLLHARVIGGEILAYKYTQCSIEGNECLYYGFIPTDGKQNESLKDTHTICRLSMQAIFPRKLYIYIEMVAMCTCKREGCYRLKSRSATSGGQAYIHFCAHNIPWSQLYVMMGDLDTNVVEGFKVPRQCMVCAQCFDCSKSVQYCRKHTKCKHKSAVALDLSSSSSSSAGNTIATDSKLSLKPSRIKSCKKI